jgi:hypothetical protein
MKMEVVYYSKAVVTPYKTKPCQNRGHYILKSMSQQVRSSYELRLQPHLNRANIDRNTMCYDIAILQNIAEMHAEPQYLELHHIT